MRRQRLIRSVKRLTAVRAEAGREPIAVSGAKAAAIAVWAEIATVITAKSPLHVPFS